MKINFNRSVKKFLESSEYKSFNSTVRDVYEQIYRSYLSSIINYEEGDTEWKDDLGIYCRYNQANIAKKIGKSLRTVNSAIRKLKEKKLIYVVEVGKMQTAKIYVKPLQLENVEFKEVVIENKEIEQAFEMTFNEAANYKEAQELNKMLKTYSISDLIEAIKKSVNVKFKKARISYITKTIKSLKNSATYSTRIIRKEAVPDWLNQKTEEKPQIIYELNEERKNLIAKIQDMSSLSKDINLYSNEEIETIIKMQEMKNMLLY